MRFAPESAIPEQSTYREQIVDMNNLQQKGVLLNVIRGLKGSWRVDLVRYRKRRSDRQNRYYWPCVVQPFGDFLRLQGEAVTDEDAHEMLKHKYARRSVVGPSGEPIEFTQSTTALTTVEFNGYVENCVGWLADSFGIVCPDPVPFREVEDSDQRRENEEAI